jgi:hypothetical protein
VHRPRGHPQACAALPPEIPAGELRGVVILLLYFGQACLPYLPYLSYLRGVVRGALAVPAAAAATTTAAGDALAAPAAAAATTTAAGAALAAPAAAAAAAAAGRGRRECCRRPGCRRPTRQSISCASCWASSAVTCARIRAKAPSERGKLARVAPAAQ